MIRKTRRHPRSTARLTACVGATLLALAAVGAAGQQMPTIDDEITLVIEEGARSAWKLAVPEPTGVDLLSGAARTAADELDATLRADLLGTGIFHLQGPAELAVLQLTGDDARDRELYRSLGNELLLTSDIVVEGDRLTLEGRLIDLASGEPVLGKRYTGTFELARRIAHTLADEIVLYFTGRRGIALTDIAFASDRSGHREIYLMDADGANQRAITAHQSLSMSPDWSPRRDVVAYVSYYNGRAPGLYLVDLGSGAKSELVTSGTLNISPSFSPDGGQVAFSRSIGDGNTEIFVSDRAGQSLPATERAPAGSTPTPPGARPVARSRSPRAAPDRPRSTS